MTTWEYKIIEYPYFSSDAGEKIKALGLEGWEAVGITHKSGENSKFIILYKREIAKPYYPGYGWGTYTP